MQKLTRSNVAHNLNISPHQYIVKYGNDTITFVFSSELYKRKFEEKLFSHRDTINQSLSNRFGFQIVNDKLADLKLYTSIEKRGFLLYHNGDKVEWLTNIILDGSNLIVMI